MGQFRRELHIWFRNNVPRWGFVEPYNVLVNMCQILKNESEHLGNVVIHTHNVIFANSRMIEEYGFRLFIHPAVGDMFEITFGECANTNREIKPHHDILKLLLSGEFDTDECKVISEDF